MRRVPVVLICLIAIAIAARAGGRDEPHNEAAQHESPAGKAAEPRGGEDDAGQDTTGKNMTYTLPPEKYEKAVAYSRAGYRLHFASEAYELLLLGALLALRVAPRLRDRAERASPKRLVQAVVFAAPLLLAIDLLQLPLDVYSHHLALKYDISVQGWASWSWDWAKAEAIKLPVLVVLIYMFYGLVRRSPRRWWLYSGLATLPLIIAFMFLTPLLFDPLFNRFEPLEQGHAALVARIEELVRRAGLDIPRERMFEMKASEKTKAVDAYVTGVGGSKRIVVYDTTMAGMSEPETLFVVGHEMGHYVLGHVTKGIAFVSVAVMLLLLAVYIAAGGALGRWGRGWGVRNLEDWASLPALMPLFVLFSFLAEPAFNNFSRYQEHQADVYGLEVTHGIVKDSGAAAAGAFQVLGEIDLADPAPGRFISFWLYSHPPLGERLVFAREYDPWSNGQPAQFVR